MGTPERNVVPLDPGFKLVLLIITAVTIVAFASMVAIAVTGATNPASKDLFRVSSDAFKVGLGAMVGLLGGKAL